MKKCLFNLAVLLLATNLTMAQSSDQKFAVTASVGISDYYGDWNKAFFNTNKAHRTQVGLTGTYYLNRWMDFGITAFYGDYGFHLPGTDGFSGSLSSADAIIRLKLNNGLILKEDAMFQPYIFGGAGVSHIAKVKQPGLDFSMNAGLGFNIMFLENLGVNYNLNYGYMTSDRRDNLAGITGGDDQYMIHSVGLIYLFGKKIDTDGDGVSDKKDQCLNTPKGVKVDELGCAVDTDGDGIADYQDDCPTVKGISKFKGCPDTDGDGIQDSEDDCPSVKGVLSAKGCPDADGDGIKDSEDTCPNKAGIVKFSGCPDSDGDGIQDSEDDCPTVKGTTAFNGCPDTDGDGIIDKEDKCPTIAGVKANNGCPEIKEETKEIFKKALKGIQFQSGRDIIKKSSYQILTNVADIMKENPTYKLVIDGHTDSQGDDAKNMTLSEKRALAVKNFLVKKGVDGNRLSHHGFGETKPKATNDTSAGRAEDRRVEFTVEF